MIVIQRPILVEKEPQWTIIVGDHYVDRAIVINVTECRAPTHLGQGKSRPGRLGHLAEFFASALVVKQLIRLAERIRSPPQRLDPIHRSIGNKQVEESIVIVIKPLSPKSSVRKSRQEQARFGGSIMKVPVGIANV